MPYQTVNELPDNVKSLPAHAKEIYMKAFNNAFDQYEGEEHKAHAVAWTAVERSFEKREGRWVAKESMSDEVKKSMLQTALTDRYKLNVENPIPSGVIVEEVFDDDLVYNVDGQSYKVTYTIGEDGMALLGEPEKVTRQVVYKPLESLQTTYSTIIYEVGRRNATLDATRVKKIVELCQELLSSEEPDEAKIKKVTKEAEKVLIWVKEQDVVKLEGEDRYPISAFAYTPDSDKPEGWKLRLWESPTAKVTKKQLRLASAFLCDGGNSGKRVYMPATDLVEVKRRLRSEHRDIGLSEDDIPQWLKEVETRQEVLSYIPLTEAKFDKGRATVIVIKPGFNATEDRYYPAEMLKRDFGVFEGQKMYADHPTEEEDKARPERSIKDWVATLSEVSVDDKGIVTGVAEIVEPWLMQKLASLRDKEMLSEMGISINAIGSASKATIDGKETLVIEKLVAARSVDFVTEPGAGGVVTFYESDRNRDVDLIELATLKEKRPDLVKLIETDVRAEIKQEVTRKMELEERVKELEGQNETLTTENTELTNQITEAENEKVKAEAQAVIKEAVDKAELPQAAKERLIERFKDAVSADGIEEAIKAEAAYIAQLTEAGKVIGLGPSKVDPDKGKEALRESAKKLHPEYTKEQIETFVTGR